MINANKKLKIFLLFVCITLNIFAGANAYNINPNFIGSISDTGSTNLYKADYSLIGGNFIGQSENSAFSNFQGYINYLDAGFAPSHYTIISNNVFLINRNIQANDTAIFKIFDFDSEPVRYIPLSFQVIDKPQNTNGDTFFSTESNSAGEVYFYFKAGDKVGSYIVESSHFDMGKKYISYSTEEMVIPAKQWRMIGVNKNPANESIDFCFNGGRPDYIYKWNPLAREDAVNQQFELANRIISGEGYFVIFPNETVLNLTGSLINDTFVKNLYVGWNQVSSPYYYLTDWKQMKIRTSDNRIISLTDAETEGIIINKIFWYKDNDYYWGPNSAIPNPKLYPWTGFWLMALKECSLIFYPGFSYSANDRINLAPRKNPSINDWELRAAVKGNLNSDLLNYIGANISASKTLDQNDVRKAPGFPDFLYTGFEQNNILCKDIRQAPILTLEEWILTVSSGNNTSISLEIPDITNLPAEYDIYLVNHKDNLYKNLRENNIVQLNQSKNSIKKYSIVVGLPEYVAAYLSPPLTPEFTYAYPNPGPNNANKINFKYNNIQANGNLRMKIFDMAGRKVIDRNIDLNTAQNLTQYEWDCRNEAGKQVSSGIYIYVLEYNSPTGSYKIKDKLGIVR
ncbi:MAG TPA: T9SS type A sorting domain-containing protein [bacterium]|nr:T9SS type A sorting domain-containing protein [bacterium]